MFSDEELGLNEPDPIPLHPTKAQAAKAWIDVRRAEDEMDRLRTYKKLTPAMKEDFKKHLHASRDATTILNRYFASGRQKNGKRRTQESKVGQDSRAESQGARSRSR